MSSGSFLAWDKKKNHSRIDTHVHFVNPAEFSYPGLANQPALLKPYTPEEFAEDSRKYHIPQLIAVEAGVAKENRHQEVAWLTQLAQQHPSLAGIIAQTDLGNSLQFREDLTVYESFPLVRGVRSIIDEEILAGSQFIRNLNTLARMNYCLELWLKPDQLEMVANSLRRTPTTRCVINHMGNPPETGSNQRWRKGIRALSELPHVSCKLSGMVLSPKLNESVQALRPILEHLIGNFGFQRLLFAGNWPRGNHRSAYQHWGKALDWMLEEYPEELRQQVYQLNARQIYGL